MQESPSKTTIFNERVHRVRLLGVGAGAPTREIGQGVTITRTAAGVYKLTWADNPGVFMGFGFGLGAATPGDVKGHTVTRAIYSSSGKSLEVSLWSATFAADDLQVTEYMDLTIVFAEGAGN